jgi:hypothetical protein
MAMPAPLGPPFGEAVFKDFATIKAALQEHARINGFAISVHSSREQRAIFKCTKGGKYDDRGKDPTVHTSRQRRNTSTIKTDCKYQVQAKKCEDQLGYLVKVLENNHNHGPVAAISALLQHRIAAMTPEEHSIARDINVLGHSPRQILNKLQQANPKSQLIPQDIYNLLASLRVEELSGKTLVEWLL